MTTIQIFDPALCCSSGVCGTDVDQNLVNFSADADWARQNGVQLERFNLAQQPMAFAENAPVKAFLERAGQEALPLTLVDGQVVLAGRYPSRADLARWAGLAVPAAAPSASSLAISGPGSLPASVSPNRSCNWLARMITPMPAVKPTVTG
ncbi:MAG: arsenite efflux transporter metallochaperone ArsD [Burkholderiaceae bacterium]|nr:arsenite efflux transporter metallochaperone ArsD [Burkholderiaceae bacterium]